MRDSVCTRLVLLGELDELRERYRDAPRKTGPQLAKRVAIARRIKDAEREIESTDRKRATERLIVIDEFGWPWRRGGEQ